MSARLELAEACEKATGPDRTLDGLIDGLFNNRPKNGDYDADENCVWRKCDGFSGLCVRSDGFARKSFCARDYTASLDAAMTLVPEGWWVQHVGYCLNGWRARVECNTGHRETLSVGVGFGCEAPIRSAALALCAAALRAREVTHEPR